MIGTWTLAQLKAGESISTKQESSYLNILEGSALVLPFFHCFEIAKNEGEAQGFKIQDKIAFNRLYFES